jgi:chromosome segregation ATPase
MKKLLTLLLTMILLATPFTTALAEGTADTTQEKTALSEEQKLAKEAYMAVHFDLMNQLTELRNETRAAVEANNSTAKTIREKLKGKDEVNQETVTEVKELAAGTKTLGEQGKQIHQQRVTLRTQYREAVKARNLDKMKALQQQMTDLNSEIKEIKEKLQSIKAEAQPLKEKIKLVREGNKQLKENIKTELQQVKELGDSIKAEQEEKPQLWDTYKENIENKDYEAAESTLKKIIEKKASILEDIKKRGEELNDILASLG